jgi:pilus assembly protein FimV
MGSASALGALSTLASAAALLCTLAGNPAHALGLGRVTVQSALGEVLRAEIDIPEITAEEAASLRVGVVSADAFKTAGPDYTAAVVGVQVSLQKRPDGRSFLRLGSSRPVSEPFIDLILEANWASGRVVRDYTLLFDPPNLRQAAPAMAQLAPPTAPILSRPAEPPVASPPAAEPQTDTSPAAAPQVAEAARPAAPRLASSSPKVAVKPGDTAGQIAVQNKPANISLDQMLVALLRSNPNAFIGGNVNRLKSGVVLDIPAAEDAGLVPAIQATRSIVAQAKDFNDFRQKLAARVPTTQLDAATRKAGGKVQANVEDRAAVAATPDKLTLSKGEVQGKVATEDEISKDKQARDATNRVAELSKNISDLNKIIGTPPAAPSAADVKVAAGPSIAPAHPVSAPVAVKKPVALLPSTPESSLIDELTDNPLVLPGLGLLLALLAGFGFYRYKKRNQQPSVDSSFLESRFQPDSHFGANDGQHIEAVEGGNATGSSLVYSPDQPVGAGDVDPIADADADADVDPIAEADVYLAYGRDLQAEEILKEALHNNPSRVAIHAKLIEIYAKRLDLIGFEAVAVEALSLTQGSGPEWAYICELGRDLNPANPMYQLGGQPLDQRDASEHLPDSSASTSDAATAPQVLLSQPEAAAAHVNFDFDLDLDFLAKNEFPQATTDEPMRMPDFRPVSAPTAATAPAAGSSMLAFDMALLSLDLDAHNTESLTPAKAAVTAMAEGPLETKLALAEEFRILGDLEGARLLAGEVAAQADSALKSKAQAFLNALS